MAFRRIAPERRAEVVAAFVATGSVRAAARETGIPPATVSRWLRGPAAAELRRVADAFKARVDLEVQRAWVEELRRPVRHPMFDITRRVGALREALVHEELRRVRSRRRRPARMTPVAPVA